MTRCSNPQAKDVVSQLRAGAAEALLKLFELHIAVGEIALNVQVLAAATAEIATESAQLAGAPESASSERLLDLASATTKMKAATNGHRLAFEQIQRDLDAWNIVPPGLRLVGVSDDRGPR